MVSRPPGAEGTLRLVVNASRKEVDFALIRQRMPSCVRLTPLPELALIALQGPLAAPTLAGLAPDDGIETMAFMSARPARIAGVETFVSRSGYTGEDGYEISLRSTEAESFARTLLGQPDVAPIGLGARDSLRSRRASASTDMNSTRPWTRSKRLFHGPSRRGGESRAAFLAASGFRTRSRWDPDRQRVGVRPEGRAPAREGAEFSADGAHRFLTSGGFGPSVNGPIAMGYVARTPLRLGRRSV